jgi:protein SCO1/2
LGKSQEPVSAASEIWPRRLALGGGLVAALLIAGAGYVWVGRAGDRGAAAPPFGGPFELTGPNGPVTQATFRGRYMLLYFGYTFCPDVCPTTLNTVVQATDRLGRKADDLQIVFITVDPARDTPTVMRDYTQAISPRIIGLTGTPDQIARVAAEYHVYYRVNAAGARDDAYSVDHSSILYLQGPNGAPLALIPADAPPDRMAADIGKYLPGST